MKKIVKGWKLFKCDEEGKLYCRPGNKRNYFEKGKWYSVEGEIKFCENGFHFHENIADLNRYYSLRDDVLCEVSCKEVLSSVNKSVCRSFKINKVLTQSEKLIIVNSGKNNSGIYNGGNHNGGNGNGGSCNGGNGNGGSYNGGDRNSGSYNGGNHNGGNCNGGNFNSGNHNGGSYNGGDRNSGNWNSCNRESGFFNTENSQEIRCFNKKTDSYIWDQCKKPRFIYLELTTFVRTGDMTDEEKQQHPEYKATGGYLKTLSYKEAFIKSFNSATKEDVKRLLKLPNFDYDVFEEISGISKEMIERKLKGK